MAEIRDYSVTADDNNAASPNGMANGCAPSTVNDTWREGIARMKRWYEDCQGAKTTTGSSNAYLLAASRVVASYAAGDAYMFKANHTNTSAGSTLNVDSVGAKAIVTPTGAAIAAGSITSGGVYLVAYEASVDKFMLIGGSHSGGDNPFIYNSSPTLTLENSTSEDTSGGRESQVVFKGLQSGSEESTLVKITASHEGTSDDQKGQLVIGVNDGDDNDAPTTAVTVASTKNVTFAGNVESPELNLKNPTSEDTSGGRESQVVFKGLQSGGEESTLVKIQASHEGTSDDEKGQLTVGVNDGNDGSSPTTAVTIASTGKTSFSQNVGLGVADPVSFLHLEKSDATAYDATDSDGQVSVGPTIYLENPANANNTVGGQIVFGMRSTEEQARIGATGGSSPSLVFGTADAQKMQITNDGEIAMPLQPAWGARGTGSVTLSGTSSYSVMANSVEVTDIGGNYNTSTYQFTAPIDGTYYVAMSFCATTNPGVTGPAQWLFKNGSVVKELGINYSSSRFITITGIYILALSAGDTIEQRVINYNNVTVTLDRSRGFFGGFLIG
ncbi:MAG: hypothetical protein CMC15_16170 [Flavobacteriaceae bacterium]|jgi:hypothetical protein|nr:hypothetical protein [Flavobacteriaceae bacterium]